MMLYKLVFLFTNNSVITLFIFLCTLYYKIFRLLFIYKNKEDYP
jgi:hypothetical protein